MANEQNLSQSKSPQTLPKTRKGQNRELDSSRRSISRNLNNKHGSTLPREAGDQGLSETPKRVANGFHATQNAIADRSARRKSAKRLATTSSHDPEGSNDELAEKERELAEYILDQNGRDESEESDPEPVELGEGEQEDGTPQPIAVETPSKRGRGRPKGSKKKRTPTPPPNLPPFEYYFFQNRPGAANQSSNNTLSSSDILSHERYYDTIRKYEEPHKDELDFLHKLHSGSFDQWLFELSQGFNICLYGYGSKRELLLNFASRISEQDGKANGKVVVVNGYETNLLVRDVLMTVARALPSIFSEKALAKLPAQPFELLGHILSALPASPSLPTDRVTLLVHSLDAAPLRRSNIQTILSRLASHPCISLVVSVDTLQFPLLWDVSVASNYNFVFHNATTFQPLDTEIAGRIGGMGSAIEADAGAGVVDMVNHLLGRSGRKLAGREGVMYVLRSLTESARALFALLLTELIAVEDTGAVENDEEAGDDDNEEIDYDGAFKGQTLAGLLGEGLNDDEDEEMPDANADELTMANQKKNSKPGTGAIHATIALRVLYSKASSQLIVTNELAFRGLLNEFYDHQIVTLKRDILGTEVLSLPWRRDEAEILLNELTEGYEA